MRNRLPWLDLMRGSAALLVVLEHLRAFLFPAYSSLVCPGIFLKAFYFLTGLGHQAVMAFFVLSGFLVGGSVFRSRDTGTWSWGGYLLRRLSRLWTVLLPALLLTAFWDQWGSFQHPEGYAGIFRAIYHSGPVPGGVLSDTVPVFLGNMFFLQTIFVPCFGTNSPLWSLANEFWYYLIFPLLLSAISPGRLMVRIPAVLIVSAILWILPWDFFQGLVIWILGALTFRFATSASMSRMGGLLPLILSLLLAFVVLLWSRRALVPAWGDLIVGCSLLPLTATLALRVTRGRWFHGLTGAMSEISYTLYLVHFPFLAWIFFTGFEGRQIVPYLHGDLLFACLLLLVLAYSTIIWWCFERNTDRIRRWVTGLSPYSQEDR